MADETMRDGAAVRRVKQAARTAAAAMVALITSCSADRGAGMARESADASAPAESASPEAQVRAAYVVTRQAEGDNDAAYALHDLVAQGSVSQLRAAIGPRGVTLTKLGADWQATLGARRAGCAEVERDGDPRAGESPSRAVLAGRAGGFAFDEWYAHGPLGMEQGFTVGGSPCGGALAIEVGVDGLVPAMRADGTGVELRDAAGVARIEYTDLFARDADGRALAATMAVEGGAIVLRVDVEGARFPVVVDPLAWVQLPKLVATDGAANDTFGTSVAVSGSTAVVGAPVNAGQGAAYVYVQSGNAWTQQAKLVASDGAAGDQFGVSVAISGSTAVVGANTKTIGSNANQGEAYVFVQSGSAWTQQAKLVASDGAASDLFGVSVAVSGSAAVVGAEYKTIGSNMEQGAAYVFVQTGSTWTQQTELVASDGSASDHLGRSVALSGSTAIAGAWHATVASNALQGAAYVFVQSGSAWTQQAELVASDGAAGDDFGLSVALSGSTAVVGAWYKTIGSNTAQGAAYVFVQSGSAWTQQAKLVAGDGAADDAFGWSVAVSGNTAVVGAYGHTVGSSSDQGAAYVEAYGPTNGTACTAGLTCVSGNCVDGVCCDTACTGQCQACDVPGSLGTCSPIAGAPHGSRAACPAAPCGGSCERDGDGGATASCEVASAGTACGSTCANDSETDNTCDGHGACMTGTAKQCPSGYPCGAVSCNTMCATNTDCSTNYVCSAMHTCLPEAAPMCSADGTSSTNGLGVVTPCTPYACNASSGSCATTCSTSAQCASPNVCSASAECIAPPSGGGTGSSGGCALVAGEEGHASVPWVGATLALAIVASSRRNRIGVRKTR